MIPRRRRRQVRHAHWLDRLVDKLGLLDPVLTSLHEARGGGWFARTLAGAAIARGALDVFRGSRHYSEVLRERGFEELESNLASLIVALLEDGGVPAVAERLGYASIVLYQHGDRPVVAAAYDEEAGAFLGLFVAEDFDLGDLLRRVVWSDGRDRTLECRRRRSGETTGAPEYSFKPLEPPELFLGKPDLDHYVDRVRKWAGDDGFVRHRAILILGMSGMGKTLLARNMVQALRPDSSAGAIVISATATRAMDPSDIVDFVLLFRPVGLVINDAFQWQEEEGEPGQYEEDLSLLETLHAVGGLTILTHMEAGYHSITAEAPYGFRPGRIDEVFRLSAPGATVRRQMILGQFGVDNGGSLPGLDEGRLDALVQRTDLFPGAYIVELCRRMQVHGVTSWRREATSVEMLLGSWFTSMKSVKRRRKAAKVRRDRARYEAVPCSRCGAEAGASCVTKSNTRTTPHTARQKAVDEAEEQEGLEAEARLTALRQDEDSPDPASDPG